MLDYTAWKAKYVRSYKNDLLYVYYNAEKQAGEYAVCCSEAQGYGLLISCLVGDQRSFDGFLRYADYFINKKGHMGWQQVGTCGEIKPAADGGENSATDGDMDMAYALLLAARRFGNAGYKTRAISICKALWDHCVNHQLGILRLGDWVEPESSFDRVTRPADFMLTHLNAFYNEDVTRRDGWLRVLNSTIDVINQQFHLNPHTGLIADFLQYTDGRWCPAKGKVLENSHDGDYYWNSCRVPWRLATYYHQTRDQRVLPILQAQKTFFEQQNDIKAGYTLAGKAINQYTDLAFLGPVSFVFWLFNSPKMGTLLQQMAELDDNTYFGETITLLCTLQAQLC